jgi:transposase
MSNSPEIAPSEVDEGVGVDGTCDADADAGAESVAIDVDGAAAAHAPRRNAETVTIEATDVRRASQLGIPLPLVAELRPQHATRRHEQRGGACPDFVDTWQLGPSSPADGVDVPNPKPPCPPEFRAEAVRLARRLDQPIRRVAMDLGISQGSLRRLVIQPEIDGGDSPGLTTDERAELTRLRRESRTLRIEREILKKPRPSSHARLTRRGDRVPIRRA